MFKLPSDGDKTGRSFKGGAWPSKIFIHVLVSWVILGSTPPRLVAEESATIKGICYQKCDNPSWWWQLHPGWEGCSPKFFQTFCPQTFHPATWARFALGILTHRSLDLQAPSEKYNFWKRLFQCIPCVIRGARDDIFYYFPTKSQNPQKHWVDWVLIGIILWLN